MEKTLQQHVMDRINDFGGIEKFLSEMTEMKSKVDDQGRRIIETILFYYSHFAHIEVDVESDMERFRPAVDEAIQYFRGHLCVDKSCVCHFYLNVLKFKVRFMTEREHRSDELLRVV